MLFSVKPIQPSTWKENANNVSCVEKSYILSETSQVDGYGYS